MGWNWKRLAPYTPTPPPPSLPRSDTTHWGGLGTGECWGTSEKLSLSPRTGSRSFQHNYTRPFPVQIRHLNNFRGGECTRETGDDGATVPGVPRLLTRLPGCARGHSARLVALGLRLLRAQVLRFGLLASRHGAKMRILEGPQEWPPEQRAFPDFGGTPPHRAESRMSRPCRPSAR